MDYIKAILSGLAAIILAACVPGPWSPFRGISSTKANRINRPRGWLAENIFSPLFWVLVVLFFALFFAASRLGNKFLESASILDSDANNFRIERHDRGTVRLPNSSFKTALSRLALPRDATVVMLQSNAMSRKRKKLQGTVQKIIKPIFPTSQRRRKSTLRVRTICIERFELKTW